MKKRPVTRPPVKAMLPADVAALPCDLCGAPAYDAQACENPDFVDGIVATELEFAAIGGMGHICQSCSTTLFDALNQSKKTTTISVRLPNKTRKKWDTKIRPKAKKRA